MSDHTVLRKPRARVTATWKLKEQMDKGWISLDAEYQRGIKWDKEKMSYLIDSMFTGFYIPPLLFAVNKKNNIIRTVIDGKQRLTAIYRFMNNEIPYIHPESLQEKFYCKINEQDDVDDDKVYLNDEELEFFDKFEFLCVEYTDITEDQEYEVFSRVQLGVAITNQERLKAHNTPIAKKCKELLNQYESLKNLLYKKSELALYQIILQLFLTLKNEDNVFQSSLARLFAFVKSSYEPSYEHITIVKHTLSFFEEASANESLLRLLKERNGRAIHLKPLDFIMFMMYRKRVERPRSTTKYINDFITLRDKLFEERGEKVTLGKETFEKGLLLIEEKVSSENLTRVARPKVQPIADNTDSDELKDEEYESYEPAVSRKKAEKRRRVEAGTPTARRGGRYPHGMSRC